MSVASFLYTCSFIRHVSKFHTIPIFILRCLTYSHFHQILSTKKTCYDYLCTTIGKIACGDWLGECLKGVLPSECCEIFKDWTAVQARKKASFCYGISISRFFHFLLILIRDFWEVLGVEEGEGNVQSARVHGPCAMHPKVRDLLEMVQINF